MKYETANEQFCNNGEGNVQTFSFFHYTSLRGGDQLLCTASLCHEAIIVVTKNKGEGQLICSIDVLMKGARSY